jgi:ABC-2 type transport system permease protein
MLRNVFTKTLWEMRRLLLGWTIGITAVGVFYATFFPAVRTPEYEQALESFAPEVLEALGFAAITTPAGYLGSTTFGLLGPVLMIIFATWFGTRAIAGDENAGKLDVLLSHPMSRWELAAHRFGSLIVASFAICLVLFAGLITVSGPAEFGEIGASNLLAASIHLAVLGIFFGGLALAIGAATSSGAIATAVVAVVGIVGYFGNTLAARVPEIAALGDVSPFRLYSGGQPLVNGFQAIDVVALAIASIVLVAIGGAMFNRRDIAV